MDSSTTTGYRLSTRDNGTLWCDIGNWNSSVGSKGVVPYSAGIWQHLVCQRSNGIMKIYVNGVLKNSSAGTTVPIDATSALLIGQFNGIMDDVKIYNHALSAYDIAKDYNSSSSFVFGASNQTVGGTSTSLDYCIPGDTSPCSPPIAEWKFEEGVGTTAYDKLWQ
jgi:hypothetical protein